jgi:hypothetical protein
MGLVEIEGVTKRAEKFIESPVSAIPCLCYKVEIEAEKIDKEGRSTWTTLAKDMAGVPFYLEDASGEILVDPTGAELDLEVIAERSTSAKAPGKPDGYAYSKLETDTHAQPPVSDEVLNGYAGAFLARKRRLAPGLGPLRDVLEWILFKIGIVSRYSHAYRFKEYCLRPGVTHVVVGTCVENPNPRDANDRNMIVKGEEQPHLRYFAGHGEAARARAPLHVGLRGVRRRHRGALRPGLPAVRTRVVFDPCRALRAGIGV